MRFLHWTCGIVKLLLAAGAKKDKITTYGDTALTLATERGHHEIVQLLQLHALPLGLSRSTLGIWSRILASGGVLLRWGCDAKGA